MIRVVDERSLVYLNNRYHDPATGTFRVELVAIARVAGGLLGSVVADDLTTLVLE
ncbi:MAG: hypothetical protein R2715_03815 [Ilumatobacteraceae bacterium]